MRHADYSLAWLLNCTKESVGRDHLQAGRIIENYFFGLITSPEEGIPLAKFDLDSFLKKYIPNLNEDHLEGAHIVYDHFVGHLVENGISVPVQ